MGEGVKFEFPAERLIFRVRACLSTLARMHLWGGSKKTRGDLVEFRASYRVDKITFIDPLVSPSTVGGKGEPKRRFLIFVSNTNTKIKWSYTKINFSNEN